MKICALHVYFEIVLPERVHIALFFVRGVTGENGALWSHVNLSMVQINYDKDAAVGSGLFQAYAIMMPTVLERAYYRA